MDKSMLPKGIDIDENLLPYKINRKYGYGKQFNAFITENGSHYHKSRCPKIKNSQRNVIHLYNAIDKYEPCSHCKPQTSVDDWYTDFISKNNDSNITYDNTGNISTLPVHSKTSVEVVTFFDNIKKNKTIAVLLATVSVLTLIIFVLGTNLYNANNRLSQLETDFMTQTESVSTLNETIENMETDIKDKDEELTELRQLRSKAIANNWESKANFLDNYIVIVTTTGRCYHRYNCQHASGGSFWAYNVEAAKSRGYYACSYCNPPLGD